MLDFYAVLGISSSATIDEIKDAYRRKVREHHPDANPHRRQEAEMLVKQIFEAYATLSDPSKRSLHDWDLANAAHDRRTGESTVAPNPTSTVQPNTAPRPQSTPPMSLLRRVREILQISTTDIAHQLGLSEAMLQQLESRDGIPQGMMQMRTFSTLVDRAARELEARGNVAEANGLRNALQRKKNQQAIFR